MPSGLQSWISKTHFFAYHWLKNPSIFLPLSERLQKKNTNRWLGHYYLGLRDSPHLFGQALSQDLLDLDLGPNGKILQYVDDLLIFSPDEKNAQWHEIQVLNFLAEREYKISSAKAQMVETKVTYLGVQTTHGSRRLSSDQVQGILQLPSPMTRKQLQAFLGLTGYCRIYTPLWSNCSAIIWKLKGMGCVGCLKRRQSLQ